MKKQILSVLTCTAITALAMASSAANAKKNVDWIEKISIKKDGINVAPVEVLPKNGRYSELRTTSYRFALSGFVKAKKRKEIARITWQSKKNPAFASGANKPSWEKRTLIRRGLRQTSAEYNKPISLSRITWVQSPVTACEKLKMQKMTAGMSQKAVLSKDWNAKATAVFYIKADVIRKKAKLKDNNYASESKMTPYQIDVRCLAAPKIAKKNASTKKGGKPPARAPRVPIE